MKISDLNLDESLRYLIAGGYTLFLKFHSIKNISALNDFVIVFAAFIIGAIEYFLFRTMAYPWIQMLLDRCSREMNGRNYIKKKWKDEPAKKINWGLRNDTWAIYQNIDSVLSGKTYSLWKTSISMLHIIGLISLFYIPINILFNLLVKAPEICGGGICDIDKASVTLFSFGLVSICCAFRSETKLEIRLCRDVLKKQEKFDKYLEQNKEQFIATV